MVVFPNCKINIGLNVCSKRSDGFHDIETVFYPVQWRDILEIIKCDKEEFIFEGLNIDCPLQDNLCYKAYRLLKNDFDLPPVKLYLYKQIPSGAGLGGGSADAAFTLKTLNDLFSLKLADDVLMQYAARLGSDCAFFIRNKPVFATECGNVFAEISVSIAGYHILIVKPPIHVSTIEAYKMVKPKAPDYSLSDIITKPVTDWKSLIRNDFEEVVFSKYPELKKIKDKLYDMGAVYAAMSGSGSAIYGLFTDKTDHRGEFKEMLCWKGELA